jgi:integrase
LSPTGKAQRLFFPTKKAAALTALQLRNRQDNFGLSLSALSPARIAEASEAYNLLEDSGLSLLDAVRTGLSAHVARTASIPFFELFSRFREARSHRSPKYQIILRGICNRFPQLHNRLACDITPADLEEILRPLKIPMRNTVLCTWRTVFNYGIKRGVLAESPTAKLEFIEQPPREVEIISNRYIAAMLEYALVEDLGFLPFLVLGFFCGIRPEGELQKLLWSDIDFADRKVVIRAEISKTRRRRFPELSENALAWLETYRQCGGQTTGNIYVCRNATDLFHRREAIRKAAGLERWVHQGMRHTFCSNWLALHKDINKLVLLSGHRSVDIMWRHYFKGTTEADARAFWSIVPPAEATRNVVPFSAPSA